MSQPFDASKSLATLEQDNTVIAVIEMSQSKWLVAAVVPGVKRQPLKKLQADEEALLKLLYRWRTEAGQTGREIKRVVVAYEAGRDGFWLARWLRTRGVEAYVIHPASIAVSREHRRAKTDRLDTELLMRAFLGWLRGEKRHCSMAAVPAAEEEDARRPNRERENLVTERTRIANQMQAILARFGIRSFKPTLRKAAEKVDGLRTAEGTPLLENTRAELSRHLSAAVPIGRLNLTRLPCDGASSRRRRCRCFLSCIQVARLGNRKGSAWPWLIHESLNAIGWHFFQLVAQPLSEVVQDAQLRCFIVQQCVERRFGLACVGVNRAPYDAQAQKGGYCPTGSRGLL